MAPTKRKATRLESAPPSVQVGSMHAESTTSLDVEALRQIVEILEASEVTRLVWQRGDERLLIRRGPAPAPAPTIVTAPVAQPLAAAPVVTAPAPAAASAPGAAAATAQDKPGHVITSPFVGTFYRAPSPTSAPFVNQGVSVKKGQTLCIIEAMKLMNEIEADEAGTVAEIYVENGAPVEFGQKLFRILPA